MNKTTTLISSCFSDPSAQDQCSTRPAAIPPIRQDPVPQVNPLPPPQRPLGIKWGWQRVNLDTPFSHWQGTTNPQPKLPSPPTNTQPALASPATNGKSGQGVRQLLDRLAKKNSPPAAIPAAAPSPPVVAGAVIEQSIDEPNTEPPELSTQLARLLEAVSQPAALETLLSLPEYLGNDSKRNPLESVAKTLFCRRIASFDAGLPTTAKTLRDLQRATLLQSILPFSDGSFRRLVELLDYLQHFDITEEFSANTARGTPSLSDPNSVRQHLVRHDAWALIQTLLNLPAGMALLHQILAKPIPPKMQAQLALLMKAASALSQTQPTSSTPLPTKSAPITPEEMRQAAVKAKGSVAGEAVQCLLAQLTESHDPIAVTGAWAVNAVRNDLYDIGPNSKFAAIEKRIAKFGVWLDRATNQSRFPLLQRLAGKSPFRALKHGTQQVERLDVAGETTQFHHHVRQAALLLHEGLREHLPMALRNELRALETATAGLEPAWRAGDSNRLAEAIMATCKLRNVSPDHAVHIMRALTCNDDTTAPAGTQHQWQAPRQLDHQLALKAAGWLEATPEGRETLQRLHSRGHTQHSATVQQRRAFSSWHSFTTSSLPKAEADRRIVSTLIAFVLDELTRRPAHTIVFDKQTIERIAKQCVTKSQWLPEPTALPDRLKKLMGKTLSPALLKEWAQAIPDTAVQIASRQADLDAALEGAHDAAYGKDTRVRKLDREKLRQVLKDIANNMQGASRLRLSSGGAIGFGTKGITAAVTQLFSGLTLRGRADLRLARSRNAVIEMAMPSYNMELVLGTQKGVAYQAGGGVAVGPDVHVAQLTAGVDVVPYGVEESGISGITFRLPRVRGKEEELRATYCQLIDRLIDQGKQKNDGNFSLLKELLTEFPNLTVNTIGEFREHRRQHQMKVEVKASIDAKVVRVAASAGIYAQAQSSIQRRYADQGGSMQSQRKTKGWQLRAGVSATVGVRSAIHNERGHREIIVGAGTLEGMNLAADFLTVGVLQRSDYVTSNGSVDLNSYFEIEFNHVEPFCAAIEANMEEWISTRAAKKKMTLDAARVEIEQFLRDTRHQATPTQTFSARSEIRPEIAKRIDVCRSMALLYRRSAEAQLSEQRAHTIHREADALNAEAERLRQHPGSYMPVSFRIYERVSRTSGWGAKYIVHASSIDLAEGVHPYSRLM